MIKLNSHPIVSIPVSFSVVSIETKRVYIHLLLILVPASTASVGGELSTNNHCTACKQDQSVLPEHRYSQGCI